MDGSPLRSGDRAGERRRCQGVLPAASGAGYDSGAEVFMAGLRPVRRRSLLLYIVDRNPFYLFSAVLMLVACKLLNDTDGWSPIGISNLLSIIATVVVYELLIVGLGLYLIAKRDLVRDGVILLGIEAFFFSDVGFLASETYQSSLDTGLAVNGVLLAIALVKLVAIFRVLRMPTRSAAFALAVVTTTLLLLHPAVLKQISDADSGRVPMLPLYALWWVAGGLIAAYGLVLRRSPASAFRGLRLSPGRAAMGHWFVFVPIVSFVAHLGTAHWVYKSPFDSVDLVPVFAAVPVLLLASAGKTFLRRPDAVALTAVSLAAAIGCAKEPPRELVLLVGQHPVTPMMLGLVAVYLVLIDSFARAYFWRMAAVGVGAGAAYAFGPTWQQWTQWLARFNRFVVDVVNAIIPQTRLAWGVLAMAGSFLMLAVGAAISLLRPNTPVAVAVSDARSDADSTHTTS